MHLSRFSSFIVHPNDSTNENVPNEWVGHLRIVVTVLPVCCEIICPSDHIGWSSIIC